MKLPTVDEIESDDYSTAQVRDMHDRITELEARYNTLLEDVRGACGCTDGEDIRAHLAEYLEVTK